MTALIFGGGGQDGYYLARLLEQSMDVVAPTHAICDVSDFSDVEATVRLLRPTYLYHLASSPSTQHDALFGNHSAIATGTLNVLEAVRRHAPECRVFIAGSALQFENSGEPIGEATPFAPTCAYAADRIAAVYTARYFRSLGLSVTVGYLFHHESPRRTAKYVSRHIVDAARRARGGWEGVVEIGDLGVIKEWTFAGDTAKAMVVLVNSQTPEAVIGSGEGHSIGEWAAACFGAVGSPWERYVRQAANFTAPYRRLVSDPRVIRSLGWQPEVSMPELAAMMMEGA